MKLFIFVLLLGGCAKPTYMNPAPGRPAGEEDKASATAVCDLKFPVSKLCLSWTWLKLPDEHTPGSMRVKIWRPNQADGSPVMIEVPGITAVLKMANMPHGSSPVYISQKDVGTYQLDNVFFSMHGPWYIYVQMKDGSGNAGEKLQIDYRF